MMHLISLYHKTIPFSSSSNYFRTKKKLAAKEKQPEETQGIEPLVYQHDTMTGKLKSKKIRKLWRKAMRYALNPDDDIKSIGKISFIKVYDKTLQP